MKSTPDIIKTESVFVIPPQPTITPIMMDDILPSESETESEDIPIALTIKKEPKKPVNITPKITPIQTNTSTIQTNTNEVQQNNTNESMKKLPCKPEYIPPALIKRSKLNTKNRDLQVPKEDGKSKLTFNDRLLYHKLRNIISYKYNTKDVSSLNNIEFDNDDDNTNWQRLTTLIKKERNAFFDYIEYFFTSKDEQRYGSEKILSDYAIKYQNIYATYNIDLKAIFFERSFQLISYLWINDYVLKQINRMISIKKNSLLQNYSKYYAFNDKQKFLKKIFKDNKSGKFEFITNLKDTNGNVCKWKLPHCKQIYSETGIKLPSALNIYETDYKTYKNDANQRHMIKIPFKSILNDDNIHEILNTNVDAKNINIIMSSSVLSLLCDIDKDLRWNESFTLPFTINIDSNGIKRLYVDKPVPKKDWNRRYTNNQYYKHVFRSYLAQNYANDLLLTTEMDSYTTQASSNMEEKLKNVEENIDKEFVKCIKDPSRKYSLWKLGNLNCLIRAKSHGIINVC